MTGEPIATWAQRELRAMGSTAVLIAGDGPLGLLDWAASELNRLERCWSRFLADSELSELNRSAGRWFPMSDTLALAVDRSFDLHWLTGGLFDPTVHDRLVELGYDRTFREIEPSLSRPVGPGAPAPGVSGIERDGTHIRLPAGVRLDLGGVGKGLGADLLATGLLDRGARSACVSLGGDIRVAGSTPEPDGWHIPIEDPLVEGATWGTVPLANSAIVTSTTLIRRWRRGSRILHHLVDPRAGEPTMNGVTAAIVIAPEAWLAEGLAKAAVVAGPDQGRALLDTGELCGWLALADGTVVPSGSAPALLHPAVRHPTATG